MMSFVACLPSGRVSTSVVVSIIQRPPPSVQTDPSQRKRTNCARAVTPPLSGQLVRSSYARTLAACGNSSALRPDAAVRAGPEHEDGKMCEVPVTMIPIRVGEFYRCGFLMGGCEAVR